MTLLLQALRQGLTPGVDDWPVIRFLLFVHSITQINTQTYRTQRSQDFDPTLGFFILLLFIIFNDEFI